jgi:hypothetical protein
LIADPVAFRISELIGHGLARTGDEDMQVQPITAIRHTRIRPKPVAEVPAARERNTNPRAGLAATAERIAPREGTGQAGIAAHAYSAYSAQLLATHQATSVDRSAQIARYSASGRTETAQPRISLSV